MVERQRKHNRLTLKSAIAAAGLALASPAPAQQTEIAPIAQTAPDTQKASELGDTLREATKTLVEKKEKIAEWKRKYGNDPLTQEMEKEALDAERALSDPQFLRGLQKIKTAGGRIEEAITAVPVETLADNGKIDAVLSRIPVGLIGNVQLQSKDFEDAPGYSYDRPRLPEAARQLSENGIRLTVGEVHEILDVEEITPSFIGSFVAFIKSTGDSVHPRNLMGSVRRGAITAKDLANEKFTTGLLRLITSGIELYNIVPDTLSATAHDDLVRKLSDTDSIERFLGLKAIGYKLDDRTFRDLPLDVVNSPDFLKNAQLLRVAGAVDYSPENLGAALKVDGLEAVMGQITPGKLYDIYGPLNFIKRVGSDAESWKVVQEQYALHANDEAALSTIRTLDKAYLKNASFISILNDVLQNKRAPDPWLNHYKATKEFLIAETGKDRISIMRSLQDYLSIVRDTRTDPLVLEIIKDDEGRAFRAPVTEMNELHNDNPARRLDQLRDITASEVFKVISIAGVDAWLSTARLLYNGNGYSGPEARNSLFARVKGEYGTFAAFFRAIRPDHKTFGTFLEFLSQNDVLDTFLTDIGPVQDQQAVLREFLFDASSGISGAQALTLSDLLRTTKGEPIREFVFDQLRDVRERQVNGKDKSPRIAGLLIADYFQGKTTMPEWARGSVQEYGKYFPEIRDLPKEKVFRREGDIERNVQVHLFYDDRVAGKPESTWDGHGSFKNFITSLGGSVSWNKDGAIQRVTVNRGYNLEDKGDYVTIRQADNRTKREVVMYINKPDRNDETVAKVGGDLIKTEKPQIVVHRGHSYHAGKTIKLIAPDTAMVNLGSCGGAKNISDVLAKAPNAQVMATRGVGTMLVNDVVIPSLNSALLRDGGIQWAQFGTQMTAEFKKRGGLAQERWGSYQMPDKNRIAHLIAALKELEK